MLSKNVLIFCAPRTGSSMLQEYLAECLDGLAITGDYGVELDILEKQNKSLILKMEETFLIPDSIKEFFPTFDPQGWTLIKLRRIDEVSHTLSLCQRVINYNYSDHEYKEFTIDKETLFLAVSMIRSCNKHINSLDPEPFDNYYEIDFEDLEDWQQVCQKLDIPYSEILEKYNGNTNNSVRNPARDKWKYVLNKEEVEGWLKEFYNLLDS